VGPMSAKKQTQRKAEREAVKHMRTLERERQQKAAREPAEAETPPAEPKAPRPAG
jgi:hypothetical protein